MRYQGLFTIQALLTLLLFVYYPSQSVARKITRVEIENDLEKFYLIPAESKLHLLGNDSYEAFYESNIWVYKYLATENADYARKFEASWKANYKRISSLPTTDALRNVFLAEMYGKRAILAMIQENYFAAVRYARQCKILIEANKKRFPHNVEQEKLLGLFNIAFSSVPRKYQWLTNLLGYKGDLKKGMVQLQKAVEKSSLLRMEAQFVSYYIERNILVKPKDALQRIYGEKIRSGSSVLVDFCLASAYIRMKKNDKALSILQKRTQYANDLKVFFIPYWDYMLGKAHYHKENYGSALKYFKKFREGHKGAMFHSDAMFREGMCHVFSDEYEAGKGVFKKLLASKQANFDSDEYGKHIAGEFIANKPGKSRISLFRARNLADGGYTDKALGELKNLQLRYSNLTSANKTELYYRYGRIYHDLGSFSKAKANYLKCLEHTSGDRLWMQVYALYYLGELMEKEGRKDTAKGYYKKALKYDKYFYQAGLESRCKTALHNLK